MKSYRIAHLGCGGRGSAHVRAIARAGSCVELVGLCDLDAGRLQSLAAECAPAARQYTDAATMLRELKPDIFSFVTKPDLRRPLVQLGIDAGVRAISLEKPMALSLAEARDICRLAADAGILMTICHQHKYGEHWRNVKALIDQGQLGRIRTVHATSMGSTTHYATHLIDYSMWLLNYSPPTWALASAHGWDRVDPTHPAPGYLMGQFALANGARVIIECGEDSPDQPGYDHPPVPSLDYWMDAGATVTGTAGVANVVVGKGWSAITSAGALGSNAVSFNGVADTVPYFQELAKSLDDPSHAHLCRAEVALLGYETLAVMYRSVCERKKITLPLDEEVPLATLREKLA